MTLNKYGRSPKPEHLMPTHAELEKQINALPVDASGRIMKTFCGYNAGVLKKVLILWNDSLDQPLELKGL